MIRLDASLALSGRQDRVIRGHPAEAIAAYLRFGKEHHKAQLNFGDCLTYAVARLADEPLHFTGPDFTETDLELA